MVPAIQSNTATSNQRDAPFAPVVLEMAAGVLKLASLPAVCTRVMQLAEDPRASAQHGSVRSMLCAKEC